MSMVINHNMMAANAARTLNTHYGNLATSTQRLSSGLRINSAADDAAGLAIRELMRADIAAYNQGIRNANDAISMIQVVDGALGVIDEKLIRMKELAEQAATGTYDSTQRLMIDSEFQAMASEIQRIATATDFNGIKLIDGKRFNSESSDIVLNNPTTHIVDKYTSETKREMDRDGKYVAQTILETVTNIKINGEQTIEYYEEDSCIYKKTTNNLTIITDGERNRLTAGGISYAEGGDLNYNSPAQLHTRIQADLLHIDSYDILCNYSYDEQREIFKYPTSYSYDGVSENTQLMGTCHAYSFNYDMNKDGVDDIRWCVYINDYRDVEYVKNNMRFDSATGYKGNALITPTITEDKSIQIEKIDPSTLNDKVLIHFGPMNDSAEDYYDIEKRDCTLKGLGLEDVRIETQDKAQEALVTINEAIVKKDQARAYYGAMQNRLENTVSNLTIQAENLQASESRISDVDVATEMTNFVRNQILTQSAVAMLSQANSMPQMAMQLIG